MEHADPSVAERKAELRARMRVARGAIPVDERPARAEAMTRRVLALPVVDAARSVLLFYAFGSEIPTRGLADAFVARGVTVLLPVVHDGEMHAAPWTADTPMERSALGFTQPAGDDRADPGSIDLVVAPGLGFDLAGHRLGYGGGFYDRFLATIHPDAVCVGIGFDEQLVDALPHDEHDVALDVVVTDARTVVTPRPPAGG